jgi:NAD+ dependent glucose-6-phosphate dehydrogenase
MRQRLVLIGGSGVVGRILLGAFAATRDLVIVDPLAPARQDVTWIEGDADGCTSEVLRPGDDVAFLATGMTGGWEALRATELDGLRVVAEAAAEVGAGRFLFASSNHVVGGYETDLIAQGYPSVTPPDELVADGRPDSEYGVAKAFGEAYLRYLAEKRRLRVSVLRIGTVRTIDDPDEAVRQGEADFLPLSEPQRIRRFRATWLYHQDLIRIVEEELVSRPWFRRRFAVSDNPGRFWPLAVEEWDGTAET